MATTALGQGTPDTFLRLRDTPDTYAGSANKYVRVNAAANKLEFVSGGGGGGAVVFTDLTDVPSSYTGESLKSVRVNAGETGLEFFTSTGVPTSRTLTIGVTALDLSADRTWLANVTNDAQTKAAIVPNTAPTSGQILVGNAGNTAYAKQTVSGSGATISLSNAGVISISAIANGSLANGAVANLSGTNTGDQTSIVGITGTKAQFDTAVTDGNILYVGDVTQYTDELAQDAVGAMVDSTLTYVDATPLLQRAALTGAIAASAGSNTTTLSSFSSANLSGALTDETGSGSAVFGTSPNITTPTGIVKGDVGLGSVTNDAQTKAAVVPNTAPSSGQILIGNAGGTAYAPKTLSGSGATATLNDSGVLTLSAIPNATLSNSAITIAATSTSLGGTITQDTITGLSSTGLVKRTAANTLGSVAFGTSGYLFRSSGSDAAAYPTSLFGTSTSQQTWANTEAYVAGSTVTIAAGDWKAQGTYYCSFDVTKTSTAGTAAPVIKVYMGTLGTTSDTVIATLTFPAQTGVADNGTIEVWATFRSVGSGTSAVLQARGRITHNLSITGLSVGVSPIALNTSAGFNSTTQTKIGISATFGTSFTGTTQLVSASLNQP